MLLSMQTRCPCVSHMEGLFRDCVAELSALRRLWTIEHNFQEALASTEVRPQNPARKLSSILKLC